MADIPVEVAADILSRLPVKSLLRFRSVCKQWCALIDGPHFIKAHLNRSIETNANLSIILWDSYLYSVDFDSLDRAIELDHPLKSESLGTEVLGSCHGLLCLSNSKKQIVLCNPSTRKHHKLPVAPIEFPPEFTRVQFIVYGFGYDSVTDDYKLARMVQFCGKEDSFDSEVKVYGLKSNTWRRVKDFPYYLPQEFFPGMTVNGAIHWLVTRKPWSDTANLIAAFDLGAEEYRLVPQPDYLDKNFDMTVVDAFEGCLCVVCNYIRVRVDIWAMKEYGVKESWTKLFSIDQPSMIRSFNYVRPLAYSKSGGEVLLDQDGQRLLWFDLKRKTVKNIKLGGVPSLFEAEICLGSLVPLRNDGGCDGKKQQPQKKMKKKDRKGRDDFLSKGFKLKL